MDEKNNGKSRSGKKRPLWLGVVVFLVICILIYAVISFFAGRGGQQQDTAMQDSQTQIAAGVSSRTDEVMGEYLTDSNGMTLYIFDNDELGKSNCYHDCAAKWPPYIESATAENVPDNLSTIERTDGTMQYALNGMPLYYFATDESPGDITGDGIGGVWHLARP